MKNRFRRCRDRRSRSKEFTLNPSRCRLFRASARRVQVSFVCLNCISWVQHYLKGRAQEKTDFWRKFETNFTFQRKFSKILEFSIENQFLDQRIIEKINCPIKPRKTRSDANSLTQTHILDPPPKSAGLLAQLTARITPNKTQNQTPPQQQAQPAPQNNDYDRSRNEPIYQQRRGSNQSNQYYDSQSIYGQQQTDGKNQNYSQSPHHQPFQQQQHQYNVYNQNIYVSTNPFISPPSNNFSSSSFGKDVTANYSSKESPKTFSF